MGVVAASAVLPTRRCVVHLFGHARVQIGDAELVVRGPIKRGLIAMLALDLGRFVHVDRLVDGLWDDDVDGDVLRSLRVHVSQLRTFLDGEVPGARQYVEGRYPLYRVSDQVTSDFSWASALRDRALDRLPHDPEGALADLDAARLLVRDDPLAEVLHLPFASFAIEPLRAFQLQLADDYADVANAAWGCSSTATSAAELASVIPMDERRWRLFTRLVDAPDGSDTDEAAARGPAAVRSLETVAGSSRVGPRPTLLPTELASRAPVVFVGRKCERAALIELQASVVRDGRTRVAQVVGPGGVGKTSLAASVADELARGGTVVRYASWSGPALAAHAPFVTAGLVRPPDSDQAHTNPLLGQEALAAEMIDQLRELGDSPVAIILDDVHRLPPRYHPVLRRLLESRDVAVLVVLLQRPEPASPELEQILPSDVHRLRLRAFSDCELDELADALGETSAPAEGRNLPWVAGLLLGAPGDAPDDRIGRAIDQLEPDDRGLLEQLALAPDGLMLRTLLHDSELTPVETLDRLRRLVSDGLVTELDGRPPRFVVAHELIAAAVRECAGPSTCIERAASLHDALAASGAPLVERVQQAITGSDLLGDRADETVTAAAKLLVSEGAFADAIALAETAHEAGVACTGRARIVVDAARALGQAALGERSDGAIRLLDLAADAADLEAWETVTTVLQWRTRLGTADPMVGKLLASALDAVDTAEPRLRFEILWCLVFDKMFTDGRIADAAVLVGEMRPIADELRDPGLRARAVACSHWIQAAVGAGPEVLDALSDELTAYAEETNDAQLIAGAHASRIGNAMRAHRLDTLDPDLEVLRRAFDPHTRWRALLVEAMLMLDRLDLTGAELAITNASTFARDRGLIIRGDEAAAQSFVLAWARGSLGELRELLEVLTPSTPGQQGWTAALALARLVCGDQPNAVALAQEVAAASRPAVGDWYSVITAALLTDVAYFSGSAELAGHVIQQLTPRSGGRVQLGLGVDLGPVDRYLALAHATLGANEQAQCLRTRARSQAACPLWAERVDRDEHASGRIVPPTDIAWSWIAT